MKRSSTAPPVVAGRLAMCLELELDIQLPVKWVRVTSSIRGRESALSKVWSLPPGGLNAQLSVDICTWIEEQFLTAITLQGGGVQELLL